MNLRAVIVDDEPLARERVRTFLAAEPDVRIVAECANGADAVTAITKHKPDLVFLDVQMPRLNGFEVLEALVPEQIPAVIFTTAHDEHAIHAFEVNALDYLLKPYTEQRFQRSVQRAREQLQKHPERMIHPPLARLLKHLHATSPGGARILVKSPDRIVFLKPEEIDHIEAAGNYVVLHTGKERHILRETMTAMEARLAGAGFARISRSVIVNLARVREVQPLMGGQYCVVLKTGPRFDMTTSLRELQSRLAEV
jgi:two-component system LytT family response regulator